MNQDLVHLNCLKELVWGKMLVCFRDVFSVYMHPYSLSRWYVQWWGEFLSPEELVKEALTSLCDFGTSSCLVLLYELHLVCSLWVGKCSKVQTGDFDQMLEHALNDTAVLAPLDINVLAVLRCNVRGGPWEGKLIEHWGCWTTVLIQQSSFYAVMVWWHRCLLLRVFLNHEEHF